MPVSVPYRACVLGALFLVPGVTVALAADEPNNWLRGFGEDLQLCLRGEVIDSNGEPAKNVQIAGRMNASVRDEPLKPSLEGHRFEIWMPVNQSNWYSLWLKASSADSDRVAYMRFNEYQLRQAAIDGIKLSLESPARQVDVKVTDQGRPVSGATVNAELGFGIELQSTTNESGVARLALLPQQKLSHLTAWTDEHCIGGFDFSRTPPRDPEDDEHVIELSRCRDQKLRFVAEDGSPVADLRFILQIATPSPNYNYIGSADHFGMTTDDAGEAVYRWCPDWDDIHFYADIDETKWVIESRPKMVDGVAIFSLKERTPRKQITGRVVADGTSPGGFYVHFRTFQGEREHYSDPASAFSDSDGTYSVTVLPDATYCAYVLDERWVGKLIDVLPYESATDITLSPELTVSEGQPVEVVVTSGPRKIPIANLNVSFHREHPFTWIDNGETHHGVGGPQWWATTDDAGKARTRTLPGKMSASIYTPRWRTEKEVDVAANRPVQISLHREIDEKRTVTGRVVLDADAAGSLEDFEETEIHVGSLDGNYEDAQSPKCKPHGLFSFDTFAAEVGIFACTKDGKAAGSIITRDLDWRITIPLLSTNDFQGQLLGSDEQPIAGHPVYAFLRLEGKKAAGARVSEVFDVKRLETKSDPQGNFTLRGIPSRMKTILMADAIDGSNNSVYLGEIFLEPNEVRPRTVYSLAKPDGR
jgi:hypothetical protein